MEASAQVMFLGRNFLAHVNHCMVIDIQDFAALALRASYNSAGLAQKKKTLALIENKFTCPGPELELIQILA